MENKCRVCGCTDNDCSGCIEKTGEPCYWVEADCGLKSECSACSDFSPPGAPTPSELFEPFGVPWDSIDQALYVVNNSTDSRDVFERNKKKRSTGRALHKK